MRIKKLASLIKDSGIAHLYTKFDSEGLAIEQWAGNGSAIYQLQKLPILDIESLVSIMDFTSKDVEKTSMYESNTNSIAALLEDTDPEEKPVTLLPMSITYKGYTYRPLLSETGNRVHLINEELFAPLDGITYQLYERNPDNIAYIAVKVGMLLIAVIHPARLHTDGNFVDTLRQIYRDIGIRHTEYENSLKDFKNQECDPYQTNL